MTHYKRYVGLNIVVSNNWNEKFPVKATIEHKQISLGEVELKEANDEFNWMKPLSNSTKAKMRSFRTRYIMRGNKSGYIPATDGERGYLLLVYTHIIKGGGVVRTLVVEEIAEAESKKNV